MNCTVSENIVTSCAEEGAISGLSTLYFVFGSQVDASTVTYGATDHSITAVGTVGAAKFVKAVARFESSDLSNEMNRDNYNRRIERTLNFFLPSDFNKDTAKLLNDYSFGKKLFVIASLNDAAASGNEKGVVFGWSQKLKENAGAKLLVNETVEAETGGLIGYNCTLSGVSDELMRRFIGTITVEDGATGETVTFE